MMSTVAQDTAHATGLPKETQPRGAKRKRQILSCFECKSRKLKCDREHPSCSRCRQSGKGDSCSYDERYQSKDAPNRPQQTTIGPYPKSTAATWSNVDDALYVRQYATASNERPACNRAGSGGPLAWRRADEEPSPPPAPQLPQKQVPINADIKVYLKPGSGLSLAETMIFRGHRFKTQYYGGSNPTSLLAHFPELRSLMKEAIALNTSLPFIQKDLKVLQVKWKHDKSQCLERLNFTDAELLRLLPGRELVDHLVQLYMDTFETVYHIIHRPSFWSEYGSFWENQTAARPAFIITLFLMMACASCLSTKFLPSYIGDSSISREHAAKWVEISDHWLRRHSQKNIYLAIWQIRCLLVLAKQVNVLKKKKTWTSSGNLIREAMSAGFHRDPVLLGENATPFEQEMRRRLWCTMTELELQASIDRGMPSASAGISSDTAVPININDEDLPVDCIQLPESKPWTEYTDSSFLHIARASFPLRVSLCSLTNDFGSPLSFEEVLKFEERITKHIQDLPSPSSPRQTQIPMLARTVLDFQLRQFLIVLHAPFARTIDANSRYSLSRMFCLNSAASIFTQYPRLSERDRILLLLLRNDYFRSALVICKTLHTTINVNSDLLLSLNIDTFAQHVDLALSLLEERISRLGTGYTHYWYISACSAFLALTLRPQETEACKQQAIDRVAKQYHRILSSQVNFVEAKNTLYPAQYGIVSNNMEEQLQTPSTMAIPDLSFLDQPSFNPTDVPLEEFYFGDPAAWTFENLWSFE